MLARMGTVRTLAATLRPPFLLLTPACVLLGLAAAAHSQGQVDARRAAVVLAGALAAHASVNVLNEWHDFRSGLDSRTQRTPFSGGSGALPARPEAAGAALGLGLLLLALAGLAGLWLLQATGWALLPIGLAGLLLVTAYTPWATRRPAWCLLAPGLGFGPLMVLGTEVAMGTGRASAAGAVASLLPLGLASGLLLLNQFPDVEADRQAGRRHLPMLLGRRAAARVFGLLVAAAFASQAAGLALGLLPPGAARVFLVLPLAGWVTAQAWRHASNTPALQPAMGGNVALNLLAPLLLAWGLVA